MVKLVPQLILKVSFTTKLPNMGLNQFVPRI